MQVDSMHVGSMRVGSMQAYSMHVDGICKLIVYMQVDGMQVDKLIQCKTAVCAQEF